MITTNLLNDLTTYVDGRIAKVVLNSTYVITDFEVKAVTDNVLALNYIVPVSDITTITLIELKDVADNVLTSNVVDVPITVDHMMLQTISVKEG